MSGQSYYVYEPARVKRHLLARADEVVFVRDGFSGWAMLVPLLWLIYYRLWLPLLGLLIVFALLQGLASLSGIDAASAGSLLMMGVSVGFGFLANDIRRAWLERRQFQLVGTVAGTSRLDCERRFFDSWQPLMEAARSAGETRP